ncbi:hypothetical protein GO755_22590 [Spirosoma sp. HMF4905]|uniref:Uncharacterized protein n=1 Tax=Spirosoma arboris TaxID=2682092 RepID=A0A7K1SGA0_9BACT|nr:hypothetical protein [Spirosoma arboris]MVM32845.1 hypothetical protein [Spirosoma arboris]
MANYFTRVEVHGAKPGDDTYPKLHEEMEKRGFIREFEDQKKKLPDGSYLLVKYDDLPARAINRLALQAVEAIGKKASIISVKFNKSEDFSVYNLETLDE